MPFSPQGPFPCWQRRSGLLSMCLMTIREGFFLVVEGGAIDWAGHHNHPARRIEERTDFSRSAHVPVQWVEEKTCWDEGRAAATSDHVSGTGSRFQNRDSHGVEAAAWNPMEIAACRGPFRCGMAQWNAYEGLRPLCGKGAGSESLSKLMKGENFIPAFLPGCWHWSSSGQNSFARWRTRKRVFSLLDRGRRFAGG